MKIYISYQSFVFPNTGNLLGYEALARWRDVNGNNISPDIFLLRLLKLQIRLKSSHVL